MRQFGDINEIREATVAQLVDVEGMNERAAESVYEFFIQWFTKRTQIDTMKKKKEKNL